MSARVEAAGASATQAAAAARTIPSTPAAPDRIADGAALWSEAAAPWRRFARLRARPGQADALRAALLELEAPTRAEPDCLGFTFFQALSDPESFALEETFRDAAALQAHLALPHTRAFFERGLVDAVDVRPLG